MSGYLDDPNLVSYLKELERRISANAAVLKPTYAQCSPGASATLANGVETAIDFTGNNAHTWNMDVTTTKVTVTLQGFYVVTSNVGFAANATGRRGIRVRRTNAASRVQTDLCGDIRAAVSGDVTRCSASGQYYMAAGDYVELLCTQTSGGTLAIEDDAAGHSEGYRGLNVFFVSP